MAAVDAAVEEARQLSPEELDALISEVEADVARRK
jgi:hypothetical protein